jgi:hypothetical protein
MNIKHKRYTCGICGNEYNTLNIYKRHVLCCMTLSQTENEHDADMEELQTQYTPHELTVLIQELYKQNKSILARLNTMETQMKFLQRKTKKVDIAKWLTKHHKDNIPILDYRGWLKTFNFNFDDLMYLVEEGYVNGLTNIIINRYWSDDNKFKTGEPLPIQCMYHNKNTFYLYDNNAKSWRRASNETMDKIMDIIHMRVGKLVVLWENSNIEKLDNPTSTESSFHSKLQKVVHGTSSSNIKMKNRAILKKIYNTIKDNMTTIVFDVEFE